MNVKELLRKIIPLALLNVVWRRNIKKALEPFWQEMLAYFHEHAEEAATYAAELNYMKANGISSFPYPFMARGKSLIGDKKVKICYSRDKESGLPFVMHKGKRLYFPKSWSAWKVKYSYASLVLEQHPNSPHRYLTERLESENFGTFVDVGAAEAMLSLELVDRVDKVLIFERDEMWGGALRKSFAPWSGKVEIIQKFVADENNESFVTLDHYAQEMTGKVLVKMDVEGNEKTVLRGARELLLGDVSILCCTYHRQGDAEDFYRVFVEQGFSTEFSDGYMLYWYYDHPSPPYFRKGLIRAWKP